jgi:hypothetical protein
VTASTLTTITQKLDSMMSAFTMLNARITEIETDHPRRTRAAAAASNAQHDNPTLAHPPDQEGGPVS